MNRKLREKGGICLWNEITVFTHTTKKCWIKLEQNCNHTTLTSIFVSSSERCVREHYLWGHNEIVHNFQIVRISSVPQYTCCFRGTDSECTDLNNAIEGCKKPICGIKWIRKTLKKALWTVPALSASVSCSPVIAWHIGANAPYSTVRFGPNLAVCFQVSMMATACMWLISVSACINSSRLRALSPSPSYALNMEAQSAKAAGLFELASWADCTLWQAIQQRFVCKQSACASSASYVEIQETLTPHSKPYQSWQVSSSFSSPPDQSPQIDFFVLFWDCFPFVFDDQVRRKVTLNHCQLHCRRKLDVRPFLWYTQAIEHEPGPRAQSDE